MLKLSENGKKRLYYNIISRIMQENDGIKPKTLFDNLVDEDYTAIEIYDGVVDLIENDEIYLDKNGNICLTWFGEHRQNMQQETS